MFDETEMKMLNKIFDLLESELNKPNSIRCYSLIRKLMEIIAEFELFYM